MGFPAEPGEIEVRRTDFNRYFRQLDNPDYIPRAHDRYRGDVMLIRGWSDRPAGYERLLVKRGRGRRQPNVGLAIDRFALPALVWRRAQVALGTPTLTQG